MNTTLDHYTHLKLHQQQQEALARKACLMNTMTPDNPGTSRPRSRYRRLLHFAMAQRRRGWDFMARPIAGYARK